MEKLTCETQKVGGFKMLILVVPEKANIIHKYN